MAVNDNDRKLGTGFSQVFDNNVVSSGNNVVSGTFGISGGSFQWNEGAWATSKPAACSHFFQQLGHTNQYACKHCKISAEVECFDLAEAMREFYKKILDEPLSAEMLHEWELMLEYVHAVQEFAVKYVPLIEEEITAKVG